MTTNTTPSTEMMLGRPRLRSDWKGEGRSLPAWTLMV
jgi:hypothetical protein